MSECKNCDITMISDDEYQICPVCGDYRPADRGWLIPGEFDGGDESDPTPTRTAAQSAARWPLRGCVSGSASRQWPCLAAAPRSR